MVLPQQVASGRPLSIGRTADNDVVLDDPLVSRHHALLHVVGPGQPALLQDLGSFNGSYVNGHRVQGSVQLAVGSEVIFGNQTFRWDGTQLLASATTEKMKSVCASGRTWSWVCVPSPQPAPASPPEPTAIRDWSVWKPAPRGSRSGSRKTRIRSRW